MTNFQRTVKNFFQRFGILIREYTPNTSEDLRRSKLLQHYQITTVFDIGANTGQYAEGIINSGYGGNIVSFEPQSKAHQLLLKRAAKYPHWQVASRMALGSERSSMQINLAANSVSSSLLEMSQSHSGFQGDAASVGAESVEVFPLDAIAPQYYSKADNLFVKVDVEGYEKQVLLGGDDTLKHANGVELEMSFIALYSGHDFLFEQAMNWMQNEGFVIRSVAPSFTNKNTGEVLQCNCIFFRK